MTTSVLDTRSSAFDGLHDPLYDMEVSDKQRFYFKVMAAYSMLFRSKRPIEKVFKLFNLTEQDLARFEELFPDAAEKMIEAAFIAAFFIDPIAWGKASQRIHLLITMVCFWYENIPLRFSTPHECLKSISVRPPVRVVSGSIGAR